jgi:hypothetical protein
MTDETTEQAQSPLSTNRSHVDDEANAFDQDLGRQLGRDAQRVADGELSEKVFYERYHEDVIAEFGEDNRPVGPNNDS